jgi:hypothetical protein
MHCVVASFWVSPQGRGALATARPWAKSAALTALRGRTTEPAAGPCAADVAVLWAQLCLDEGAAERLLALDGMAERVERALAQGRDLYGVAWLDGAQLAWASLGDVPHTWSHRQQLSAAAQEEFLKTRPLPTRSQLLAEAGFRRRASAKSLPSDA